MPIGWLDIHAGAVQAFCSIAIVCLTIGLVWVTYSYAKIARLQRFDAYRPVIHPSGTPPMESGHVDWKQLHCELRLRNVGSGVALIVCGVLFPPEPEHPSSDIPQRFTFWRESAVLPGSDDRSIELEQGVTKMGGDAMIGPHKLFAPRRPTLGESIRGGHYNTLARLTLTYEDIFSHKHAAVFDYIDLYKWQCVALISDISTSLEDVAQKAD